MKHLSTTLTIIFISLFQMQMASAQTTHTITLHVNTSDITKSNLSSTCNFGQSADISNEDFNLDVNIGDDVVWDIVATDDMPREVNIINIKYEKGRNLFRKDKITKKGGVVKGLVVAGAKGQSEKYSIRFKVKGKGTFVIDPKITIKN